MKRVLLLLIIAFLGFATLSQAQLSREQISRASSMGIDLNNIQDIDVDELSDDQIGALIDRIDNSGFDEDQLWVMARARGATESQIRDLRRRIQQYRMGIRNDSVDSENPFGRPQSDTTDLVLEMEQVNMDSIPDNTIDGLKVFGLDFFSKTQLQFNSGINTPTPRNYILGPGDELMAEVWGASEMNYPLIITPDGNVRIERLGPIFVSGLTIEAAKSKIISRLKRIHSTIGSSSYADVSISQIKTINVHVIGRVNMPGTYALNSFGTAFNALYEAGGPTLEGSLRRIEIFRNRELVSTFDAYEFFVRGTGENLTLQDQDVIIVQPYVNRVKFEGEVKTPAYFELTKGETFADLLYYTGGFTREAYRGNIGVLRYENNFKTNKTILEDSYDSFEMKNGDEITIGEIPDDFKTAVFIEGAVYNPGTFELTEGMKLSDLLKLADGFKGDAFMKRGVIIRQSDDLMKSTLSFSPNELMRGKGDIELKNRDVVRVESIYGMREPYQIRIDGSVRYPGEYEYMDHMTVENLIFLSGGFKESAARSFVEVARRNAADSETDENKSAEIFKFEVSDDLSLSDKASTFELLPFDKVMVRDNPYYQEQELILVEGEALFPGTYSLETKDERISSILERAGGLTSYAYAKGATLIRRTEYFGDKANEAAEMRRKDLTFRFRKEGLINSNRDSLMLDSLELFRQKESIGIALAEIIKSPGSKYDLIMREGDILSIPREFETVRARGEVLYPSNIHFVKGKKLKHYIATAGGFDQEAKKSKSYIIYANGSAAQTHNWFGIKFYPKVEPGAEIVVPKKPERTPMTAQAWVALASSVATLALIISQITSN